MVYGLKYTERSPHAGQYVCYDWTKERYYASPDYCADIVGYDTDDREEAKLFEEHSKADYLEAYEWDAEWEWDVKEQQFVARKKEAA